MLDKFDNSIVIQVQQANDIIDVISEHVNLIRKGQEMVGLCPFHDDHRPSMNVSSTKQIFKCFACGAGGDVFKFVQMRENLTFPQAIERLAERAGIKLKPFNAAKGRDSEPAGIDPNKLARLNAWAVDCFQKNLCSQAGKAARDYIAKRQITPESVKKWQLGLAVDSQDHLLAAAKARGIPAKLLEEAGLVAAYKDGNNLRDKFIHRLMFPITDVTGRVIGFGGRTLGSAEAKYINSPTTVLFDKTNSLYGLEQARHQIVSTGAAVIVEGYTDCLMAHQFGCANVVATLGTSFTMGHARILRRYAKKVVLIFDSDIAGNEAANRALEICLSQRIDIKITAVPQGKDPCDFLLVAGKEQFEKLADSAADVFKFKWSRLTENLAKDDTISGNKAAIEEFLQTVATGLRAGNLTAIEKGLIINRLSRTIGLDSKQINAELSKKIGQAAKTTSYLKNQKVQTVNLGAGLLAAAQREILEVLLNDPGLFEIVKQKVAAEAFDVPVLRQIAAVLFEILNAGTNVSLAGILAKVESADVGRCIVELASAGEEKGNFQCRLKGSLDVLERSQSRKKNSEIKTMEDQSQFLRHICENAAKKNPHNVGMV